jgi:uncharacterized iron-regulated membrane protein
MQKSFRKLHRKLAPILFLPLFLTAITGVAYRLGRSWFDIPGSLAGWLLTFHRGSFLGNALAPVYVLLMGLGLIGLIVTGLTMIRRQRNKSQATKPTNPKRDHRWAHRIFAPIAFLPLLVSAVTGIAYYLGEAWFSLPGDVKGLLMNLHQGSYLGATLRQVYVLLVGVGLVGLLVTGLNMTGIFRKRKQASPN